MRWQPRAPLLRFQAGSSTNRIGRVRLVSYGEQARLGAIVGELVIDLAGASSNAPWSGSMLELLQVGPEALAAAKQVVASAAEEHRQPLSDVKLLAPLPRPSSLRDAMTFERHVLQVTRAAGLGPLAPVDRVLERLVGARRSLAGRLNAEFYRQPPYYRSNERSVVGPDAQVRIPRGCERFDYELEWGVVIGREGRTSLRGGWGVHRGLHDLQRLLRARYPARRNAQPSGSG